MIELHTRIIFQRPASCPVTARLSEGEHLLELQADATDRISQCYRQQGMRGDPARISRRFSNGARFFAIEQDGVLIAWTWALIGVPRYMDEFAWMIQLDQNQAWGRDAFVLPSRRGKRLLLALVDAAAILEGRAMQFFSDVDPANRVSMQAHLAMGMTPLTRIRALSIGQRLIVRQRPDPALPPLQGMRPDQRLLWMKPDDLQWHRMRIA